MRVPHLLALTLLLGACTHSRTVAGSDAREALADGRRVPATSLRADLDSVSWVDPATGALASAPVADVRSVTVGGRRGRGLLEGFLLGTAVGAGTGALLGYATYEESPSSGSEYGDWCIVACSKGEAALLVGFLGGIAGSVVGSGAGLVRGSPTAFVLTPEVSPYAPARAVVGPPAREAP